MAKNDAKFLRVKNDPVAATALPSPVADSDTQIHYGSHYAMESSGDGAEWQVTTQEWEFTTDKRIHFTVNAAYNAFSDPTWISVQGVSPLPYMNGFYNPIEVHGFSTGYPGPSVSWTATIDLPAGTYAFEINGRAEAVGEPFNVNWNLVVVNHPYESGTSS